MTSEDKHFNKLALGMILLALGGLLLGAVLGYVGTNMYLSKQVLKDMKADGYVLTTDATATAEDIVSGKNAYVNGVLINGTKDVLDTSDATATSEYIVRGKTAFVNGELVVGTMDTISGKTIQPSSNPTTISGGVLLVGDIVIKGDENLVSGNIKKGIFFYNINGSYVKTED